MSEISSLRASGAYGTAAVRAIDKSQQPGWEQNRQREARIERLKEQYQAGQYSVDAVELSSAIVSDLLTYKL